jgi:opacity protein-like surface antigen
MRTKEEAMQHPALKLLVVAATVALVSAPAFAHADGYFTPWAGVNFGGSRQMEGHGNYGFSAGYMGGGIIGPELDFGYAPNFFGETATNYTMTLSGNLILGVPVGGTRGGGVRPYVTGGLGWIRANTNGGLSNDTSTNDLGWNAGAGVQGYFNQHVGLRGDVRYFRTFNNPEFPSNLDFTTGRLDFWRGSIGIVIR